MFRSAKLKLTLTYLFIVMAVSLMFSSFVYVGVMTATERALESQKRRFEKRLDVGPAPYPRPLGQGRMIDTETLMEIREKTVISLILINACLFLCAGFLGYFVAGKTLKPIEEAMLKQKRFISDAAHEIKTPLTALKASLEVAIRDKGLTVDEAKTNMKGAVSDVDSLHSLVESLLLQSKMQNGINDKQSQIELNELVSHVTQKLDPIFKGHKVKLSYSPLPQKVIIKGNEENLKNAITNIIENAVKYNKEEGEVSVGIEQKNGVAKLLIKDTGIGISSEDVAHIFDPFFRSDRSRSKNNVSGYGLGLTIAKEIISKHSGKLLVKSQEGIGTEFQVVLPISGSSQVS